MKKLLLFTAIILYSAASFCQSGYWQQRTDYHITVSLNDADNSLTGYEAIDYYNNSPDTLHFIWIHIWPNAYKNDRTAFSDQLLENGRTDFYFSEENKRGYINRLSFKADNENAVTEDHPQHQDIVKLLLPHPLAPGKKVKIETPFHEKLPYDFSRGGHILQSYQITQWYPKPAVYDKTGWHEMPYLDQGEFYSEFGSFDVEITLPANYIVAATGNLQNESEKKMLKQKALDSLWPPMKFKNVPSNKTLRYTQNNVHDFAWFADKTFVVKSDTLQLPSGKTIDVFAFVLPKHEAVWKNSIADIKKAVLSKSRWVGEYPYDIVSVVDNAAPVSGGMEYPTITLLSAGGSEAGLESVINHEVGHNWFYGILGTNERLHGWMDEGINTYYDKRYAAEYLDPTKNPFTHNAFLSKRIPADPGVNILQTVIKIKKDQPIDISSEKFSMLNYGLIVYEKTGEWMQKLQAALGKEMFDQVMQAYFKKWKFKHPAPEDLKAVAEEVSGRSLTDIFKDLNQKGPLEKPAKKQLKFASFFNLKETNKYSYISVAPAIGGNFYDKLMIGVAIHNYNLPPSDLQFIAVPLYATGTSKFNGIGRVEYNWHPGSKGARLTLSASGEKFTGDSYTDSTGQKNPLQFSKIVPSLKYVFANKYPRSHTMKYIQWKTFIINEDGLFFTRDTVNNIDIITYPAMQRYLNQLSLGIENNRALYPYNAVLQGEQGDGFVRLNFTGNYYFNYAKGGGLNVRLFAGKFIYTNDNSFINQYSTDRYHLNMTGPNGYEDYTYSNYFTGRNEFRGASSQQIMNRDGFFKVRSDLLSSKIGKTDDWLSAVNLTTSIPKSINPLELLPVKIPVKLFVDIGTYAEAWKKTSTTGRFLFDGGVQVSLFKNLVNVYAPFVYSKVYRDYFKSTITGSRFVKNISFSLDIQQLKFRSFFPQLSL